MKTLPSVGYDHTGAVQRNRALFRNRGLTLEQAIAEIEEEDGRKLSKTERREFMRGWRVGGVTFPLNGIRDAIKCLNAEQLEALSADLFALAEKHKIELSID